MNFFPQNNINWITMTFPQNSSAFQEFNHEVEGSVDKSYNLCQNSDVSYQSFLLFIF